MSETNKQSKPNKPELSSIEQDIAGQVVKKKPGAKSASLEANLTATNAEIKEILHNNLYWYKREPVKTDEECAERLDEFFARLAETGEIPTVEKMCLALGTYRQLLNNWEHGSKGPVRMDMIKRAKGILAALDAELVSRNKIPQITYIFRAKNFFGMSDKTEVEVSPKQPLGDMADREALERRLLELPDSGDSGDYQS